MFTSLSLSLSLSLSHSDKFTVKRTHKINYIWLKSASVEFESLNMSFTFILHYLIDCERKFCWLCSCLLSLWTEVGTRSKVTGKFWTTCPHTSQVLFPLVLNHLTAHSSCTSLRAPLQLHSILSVFPSSHTSRQILHTASSSGISSSLPSVGVEVIWSDVPENWIYKC